MGASWTQRRRGGRRCGRLPVGEAWLFALQRVKGTLRNLRYVWVWRQVGLKEGCPAAALASQVQTKSVFCWSKPGCWTLGLAMGSGFSGYVTVGKLSKIRFNAGGIENVGRDELELVFDVAVDAERAPDWGARGCCRCCKAGIVLGVNGSQGGW